MGVTQKGALSTSATEVKPSRMGGAAGGGRAARALRVLLLAVMALAAVEYLFGSILEASPLRTYLYTPLYNATQPTLKSRDKSSSSWPKRLSTTDVIVVEPSMEPMVATETSPPTLKLNSTVHNTTIEIKINATKQSNKTNQQINAKQMNATKLSNKTNKQMNATKQSTSSVLIDKIKIGLKKNKTNDIANLTKEDLPYCDLPSDLGPIPVNKSDIKLEFVEMKYPQVLKGGWYIPFNCTGRHKVAIIVPYRDRKEHLAIMLNHLHPFLMRQQMEYRIFVINQQGYRPFNRAKLFNVGFVESNKMRPGGWECFIFHDVDLLPLDERNLYSCPRQPRHMSASIDISNFKLPYETLFGGVSAITFKQFTDVNGFSNRYWGWGGEDDDISARISAMHYHISRYPMSIARYAMLRHKKASANPKRYKLLEQTVKSIKKDGLSSLKYEVVGIELHHLFTLINVNIDENS